MFKITKLAVILIVVACLIHNIHGKYGKSDSGDENNLKNKDSKGGVGISAWGLIFVILTCIFIGVGAYYAAVFYPLLCKKERKYDRIELSSI